MPVLTHRALVKNPLASRGLNAQPTSDTGWAMPPSEFLTPGSFQRLILQVLKFHLDRL